MLRRAIFINFMEFILKTMMHHIKFQHPYVLASLPNVTSTVWYFAKMIEFFAIERTSYLTLSGVVFTNLFELSSIKESVQGEMRCQRSKQNKIQLYSLYCSIIKYKPILANTKKSKFKLDKNLTINVSKTNDEDVYIN